MRKLYLYFFVLFFSASPLVGEQISHYAMEQSYKHATRVIKQYPAKNNYVVALGVSTVPFSSSVRQQLDDKTADEYFRELPVTSLAHRGSDTETRHRALANLLPTAEELSGRTLVIHRVLDEGQSISFFMPDLMEFMRKYRPGIKVKFDFVLGNDLDYTKFNLVPAIDRSNARALRGEQTLSLNEDFNIIEDERYANDVTWNVSRGEPDALIEFGRWKTFGIPEAAQDNFQLPLNPQAKRLDRKIADHMHARKNRTLFQKFVAFCGLEGAITESQ